MGYEIIYKTFTVEKNGEYIPFVVCGSNNCYEGRRRVRNLCEAGIFFNHKTGFKTLAEMNNHFDFNNISNYLEEGTLQGRYSTAGGLLKSFSRYVFNYKEIPLVQGLGSTYFMGLTPNEESVLEGIFEDALRDIREVLSKKEKYALIDKCLNSPQLETKTIKKLLGSITDKGQLLGYHYQCIVGRNERTIDRAFYNKKRNDKKLKMKQVGW